MRIFLYPLSILNLQLDSRRARTPSTYYPPLLPFSHLSQIYIGGAALTDAVYKQACPTRNGAPAALASPAYKRKRSHVELSPFVGGKVCPIGEQACPLSGSNAFECINVNVDLG